MIIKSTPINLDCQKKSFGFAYDEKEEANNR